MLQLKKQIIRDSQDWRTVFLTSVVLNVLAYLGFIVHFTYAVDDYGSCFSTVNHTAHGRWLADFIYNILLQKSFMPTLAPVIGMICYILTGIGLCKLWNLSPRTGLPIIALWSLHPYMLDVYNFRIATVNCAVVYLLATLSLLLASRGKQTFVWTVVLFYLALSIYQVVLGFAVAAIMVQVLLIAFRNNFSGKSCIEGTKLLGRYILLLISSVIVYLIFTKLLFAFLDVDANSRIQEGFISDIEQLKAKIGVVLSVLIVRLGPIKEFVLGFVGKLGIFIIYLAAILVIVKKPSQLWTKFAVLLWVGMIPLGAISFMLPLATHDMPWRICMGLVVFFAGMYALTQESESLLVRRIGITVAAFLVIYFILNNNTILYKQHLTNQQDLIMGNRIIAKIQSLDGYQPGMELAIVGRIEKERFSKEGKSNLEIVREYIKYCSIRQGSLATSAFERDWSKYSFLLKYMDLELKRCGPVNFKKAFAFSQGRKPWPDPSSVFVQDDIVTVILSQEGI